MSGADTGTLRLVEFLVSGERYAVRMDAVERVVGLSESGGTGAEAGAPAVMAAERLGLPGGAAPRWGLLIRREGGEMVLGVERVEGVREVPRRALVDAPDRAGSGEGVVAGLVRMDGQLVVLLNEAAL